MIIDDLPSISIANDSDEIAIEQGTATKKITKGNFLQEVTSAISSLLSSLSGKVSKSGDTMSGNLFINSPINTNYGIYEQSDYLDSTSAPSNDTYTIGLRFRDKNNVQTGMFNNGYLTTGNVVTQMIAQRPVNGSNVQNLLRLGVMLDGTRAVTLSDPAAWRSALGLTYAANNTYSATSVQFAGYISANSREVAFTVPVDKSLENISSVSVTTLTGLFRTHSGFVDNVSSSASWLSGYTVTANKRSNNLVQVSVQKSSAMANVTANTVAVASVNITLKFT